MIKDLFGTALPGYSQLQEFVELEPGPEFVGVIFLGQRGGMPQLVNKKGVTPGFKAQSGEGIPSTLTIRLQLRLQKMRPKLGGTRKMGFD